ncbi:MAG: GHKL domain-containing protein [Clostridia bacterium]|nr:GHKL domain-containing protein [Clostridia bacterium]
MTDPLYSLFYLSDDLCAALSLYVIFRYIFLKKCRKSIILSVVFGLLFASNAFVAAPLLSRYLYDFDGFLDLISLALLIGAACAFFPENKRRDLKESEDKGIVSSGKKKQREHAFLKTFFTVIIYDSTVEMFYSLIAPYIDGNRLYEEIICTALHLAVFASVRIFASRSAVNVLPEAFSRLPKWIFAVILLFELTCYYKEFGVAKSWYNVLYTVSSAAVIFCLLYLFTMIFRLIRQQNDIMEQLRIRKDYGESVSKGDEELRAFRHDYKNHMMVVNTLLSPGRTDEAQKYLDSISAGVNGSVNRINSGNYIADALLNNKAVVLRQNNARFTFTGRIPESGIQSEDLCTVLANLLDNAAEAVVQYPERYVSVSAGVTGQSFHLKIENPTVRKDKKGVFATSKQDKLNHGIGLKNVRRIVESYDGQLLTEARDGIFTAEVMMQLEEEAETPKS